MAVEAPQFDTIKSTIPEQVALLHSQIDNAQSMCGNQEGTNRAHCLYDAGADFQNRADNIEKTSPSITFNEIVLLSTVTMRAEGMQIKARINLES